ncbi:MAG: hypothetical protein R3232_11445, partial [Clostridia bacterium]|nr:hypothetical protein [Clostridia bacterium]
YRSSATYYKWGINSAITNLFTGEHAYIFSKYFSEIEIGELALSYNYFDNEGVFRNAHAAILDDGFDISYEDFKKGVSTFYRFNSQYNMITVTFTDKELSIAALDRLLESGQTEFEKEIQRRIDEEINLREGMDKFIEDSIAEQEDQEKIAYLMEEKSENRERLEILRIMKENRVRRIYAENLKTKEQGYAVDRFTWGIGLSVFMIMCVGWVVFFYVLHVLSEMRKLKQVSDNKK